MTKPLFGFAICSLVILFSLGDGVHSIAGLEERGARGNNRKTKCLNEYENGMKMARQMADYFPRTCDKNGKYKTVDCNYFWGNIGCFCVDKETGKEIQYTFNKLFSYNQMKCEQPDCIGEEDKVESIELTECQKEADGFAKSEIEGNHNPRACDINGKYVPVDCAYTIDLWGCWCIDKETGEEIGGTFKDGAQSNEIKCEDSTGKACYDRHGRCSEWAKYGKCMKNPHWMKIICQQSCGCTHVVVSTPQCPNMNLWCPYWASVGECTKNPRYMKHMCKASCKLCE